MKPVANPKYFRFEMKCTGTLKRLGTLKPELDGLMVGDYNGCQQMIMIQHDQPIDFLLQHELHQDFTAVTLRPGRTACSSAVIMPSANLGLSTLNHGIYVFIFNYFHLTTLH